MSIEAVVAPLTFHWDWSKAEHIRLHRALMRAVWRNGKLRIFRSIFLFVLGVGLLATLYALIQGNSVLFGNMVPWFMIIALWWAIFTWLLPRSSARAYLRFHKGKQRLSLTHDGVESGCDVCSNQLRWDVFQRAVETREFFLLFYTSQCAVYLPKRVLESDRERDRVRSFLQAHVPGKVSLEEKRT